MGSEWTKVSIESIQANEKGAIAIGPFGSRLKSDNYVESGVPVIRGTNVTGGPTLEGDFVYITEEKADTLGSCNVYKNELVFPHRGSIGEVGIIKENNRYVLSSSLMKLKVDEEQVDPLFVYYFFKSALGKHELLKNASQVGTPGIGQPLTSLKKIEFHKPSLSQQKKIANILSSLDERIAINSQINQTLEQMAQTIFKSWFVDFDPVKAKMNGEQPEGMDAATASLFPDKLVESELGLIPEGWSASKLEDLVDIASSKRVFAKEYLDDGVPFYRGKEITELSKGNSVTPEIYISEERYQELKDKAGAPKENDILITSVGTIGNTYLVDSEDKFYFKDGNLTWVKDYKEEIIPYFLMEWFKSSVGKSAIENIKIGSTQQAITIKSLNGIKLVAPSCAVHEKFTQIVEPLYKKHRANIKQNKALSTLRDTLLPKLLSGEIELGQLAGEPE